VNSLVIESEEELTRKLQDGWKIYKDARGFRLRDPETGKFERIANELEDEASYYYEKLNETSTPSNTTSSQTPPQTTQEQTKEQDIKYIVDSMKTKIDSRSPISKKWAEDISWWHHIIYDTANYLLPDLLSRLSPNEIDLDKPERTEKAIVEHFQELKKNSLDMEAIKQKYEMEIQSLNSKIQMLQDKINTLNYIADQYKKMYENIAERTKQTIQFFLLQIPIYLPENARDTYKTLAGKITKIWEGVDIEQ